MKIQRTPTLRRMPTYLHKLYLMRQEGKTYASSTDLANYMNIDLIVTRKDIAMTGLAGHRHYGYKIDELIDAILRYVGWDKALPATLIGAVADALISSVISGCFGIFLMPYVNLSVCGFYLRASGKYGEGGAQQNNRCGEI